MPRISIVMPVWNGEKYLREAVDGILAQTFKDFELIAIDDGSTDETVSILESYRDERIRIVKQGRMGFVAAVNRGVAEARAEWIARHDADDISSPLRLQKQWDAIQRNPSAVMATCALEVFGDQNDATKEAYLARTKALIALKSCFVHAVSVGAALIKRSAYLAVDGYRESEFPAEDYAFVSRLLPAGDIVTISEPLYRVRKHEAQISTVKRQAQIEQSERIALQNCRAFFGVDEAAAQRIWKNLRGGEEDHFLGEWFRFILRDLPRFPWQSPELWAWVFSQTARRIARKIKPS